MIELSFKNDLYVARGETPEGRRVIAKAGFRLAKCKTHFYTPSHKVAARLRDYADAIAESQFKRILISVSPWSGRLRWPTGLTPLFFQKLAAFFALARNRCYLALDPGLGKTIVAALIINALPGVAFAYVCPPFLTLNVEEKLKAWTGKTICVYPRDEYTNQDILIMPDSRLGLLEARSLMALHGCRSFTVDPYLFIDEAHRYNNDESKRSQAIYDIAELFPRQAWLSGTPMNNRPIELYPVLSKCAPESIDHMTKFDFGRKYCQGHRTRFGWDFRGASNLNPLAEKVLVSYDDYKLFGETSLTQSTFMIRVKKSVLGRKPVREELVFVGEALPAHVAKFEEAILKEHSPKDLMKRILSPEGELHISTYRKELGLAKVKPSLPFLRSIMDDTEENMIVVVIHKDVMDLLEEKLTSYRPYRIDGRVPPHKRDGIAKEYQRTKGRRLMLLNGEAGGIGLDMPKTDRVSFLEFSWVPSKNGQVVDRGDRYGRPKHLDVLAQYLIYKNSIDRVVMERNFKKRRITNYI